MMCMINMLTTIIEMPNSTVYLIYKELMHDKLQLRWFYDCLRHLSIYCSVCFFEGAFNTQLSHNYSIESSKLPTDQPITIPSCNSKVQPEEKHTNNRIQLNTESVYH